MFQFWLPFFYHSSLPQLGTILDYDRIIRRMSERVPGLPDRSQTIEYIKSVQDRRDAINSELAEIRLRYGIGEKYFSAQLEKSEPEIDNIIKFWTDAGILALANSLAIENGAYLEILHWGIFISFIDTGYRFNIWPYSDQATESECKFIRIAIQPEHKWDDVRMMEVENPNRGLIEVNGKFIGIDGSFETLLNEALANPLDDSSDLP